MKRTLLIIIYLLLTPYASGEDCSKLIKKHLLQKSRKGRLPRLSIKSTLTKKEKFQYARVTPDDVDNITHFLSKVDMKKGELVTFRGQDKLTDNIRSKALRSRKYKSLDQVRLAYDEMLILSTK